MPSAAGAWWRSVRYAVAVVSRHVGPLAQDTRTGGQVDVEPGRRLDDRLDLDEDRAGVVLLVLGEADAAGVDVRPDLALGAERRTGRDVRDAQQRKAVAPEFEDEMVGERVRGDQPLAGAAGRQLAPVPGRLDRRRHQPELGRAEVRGDHERCGYAVGRPYVVDPVLDARLADRRTSVGVVAGRSAGIA